MTGGAIIGAEYKGVSRLALESESLAMARDRIEGERASWRQRMRRRASALRLHALLAASGADLPNAPLLNLLLAPAPAKRIRLSRRLALLVFVVLTYSAALAHAEEDDDSLSDSVVVTATRSGQLVRDQPLRVEVVPAVELEESLSVAPGNLTNLLNELAGARMQASAPGLGGTALQLRGLPGRHAQILSDGLPLAGAQSDSFSLMQTPPLDLSRVELIKGVASALYGGAALAGVMNLVSREPSDESNVLLNRTSVGGSDAVAFLADSISSSLGLTLTGGANYQSREDPDHDGWAELPGYQRATFRPRMFWSGSDDRSIFATLGYMQEDRTGGTMSGRTLADGEAFAEELHTRRLDAGTVAKFPWEDTRVSVRWSANVTDHDREYGNTRVDDTETSVLGEALIQGELQAHKWTLGTAFQYESMNTRDVAGVSFHYSVPAIFMQDEYAPAKWLSLAASARVDAHSDYGTFLSPRVSALFRTGSNWSLRASFGTGFAAPTPLVEDVQARSLALLDPLHDLRAERASSASLDLKWAEKPWDVNVSVFSSEIRHPLDVVITDRLELINDDTPFRSRGAELLVGFTVGPVHMLANSTYLDVTDAGGRAELIPRFSAELATIVEDEALGRVGVEISYTGTQAVDERRTPSYVEVNALAEVKVGKASIFANALNLTNVRQRDYEPLVVPLTDAWAPLVGRTFNLGVRLML